MAFDELYKTYWQRIFRLCMGYVNDYESAQDLAQETFITVWQQLPSFRNESDVGTWIFRIASNNCLRQIERGKRFVRDDFPDNLFEEKQPSLEPQIQQLLTYISELPETDRILISLALEEVKQADIAQIMGLSETNVRVKIHRIKEKLTQKFTKNGQQS